MLLVAGCGGPFPQSTFLPRSDFAAEIDGLFWLTFRLAVVVFVVVEGLLIYTLMRFRRREGAAPPKPVFGHTPLEIGWTIAPAFILIIIAVPTIRVIFETSESPVGDALEVEVVGRQWWWEFRYPDLGITTANELHIPVGRPVRVAITSADVIHSFWAPGLGGKRDAVQGQVNYIYLTPDSVGEYLGQCAEYCGTSHANMRLRVMVDSPLDFERWVANELTPPLEPAAGSLEADGKEAFLRGGCVACHTVTGVSGGLLGPNLSHFGSRRTLGSGLFANSSEILAEWIRDPQGLKPGSLMVLPVALTEQQVQALVAYLNSLQ